MLSLSLCLGRSSAAGGRLRPLSDDRRSGGGSIKWAKGWGARQAGMRFIDQIADLDDCGLGSIVGVDDVQVLGESDI